jgi:hypothetical protein
VEAVVAYFSVLSGSWTGGTAENHVNVNEGSQCADRYLKPLPSEYKLHELPLT